MNRCDSSPNPSREDVYRLANAALCGEISETERRQLECLVADNSAARRWYVEFICDACNTRARVQTSGSEAATPAVVAIGGDCPNFRGHRGAAVVDGNGTVPFDAVPLYAGNDMDANHGRPSSPVINLFGGVLHGTAGYFSQVGPLSYLIATFIMLVMGVVAWNWKLPDHTQIAGNKSGTGSLFQNSPEGSPRPAIVGRITGMVDCQWESSANPKSKIQNPKSLVALGDKYVLASGLMEITYDTGAKVILQGPITYEVESAASGYLAVGKLTAKLEKKEERRTKNEELSGSNSSFLIPHSYFAVRTPTAVVTDLGTEFGVEVGEAGVTETHVFVGTVKLEDGRRTGEASERILLAGQTARLEGQAAVEVSSNSGNNGRQFVRKMPAANGYTCELIDQIDYSDTWTANSPTRVGGYVDLVAEAAQVEDSHGNPPRCWVFSQPSVLTIWSSGNSPWPGFQADGTTTGFTETVFVGYMGFAYGIRDTFMVQFDAVQTEDRINITIGDKPATIDSPQSLSVFFRAPNGPNPEIGIYAASKGEVDTGLRSGITVPFQWHNYAVQFSLRGKRLVIWLDGKRCGEVDLTGVSKGMATGRTWADLPWTNRYVTVGGTNRTDRCRLWTDNFRIGIPFDNRSLDHGRTSQ